MVDYLILHAFPEMNHLRNLAILIWVETDISPEMAVLKALNIITVVMKLFFNLLKVLQNDGFACLNEVQRS